ncbi:stromal membrane-associated protein 1-like isoform X2 [Tachypleus tridentatus]|uniref:stromal membrane-associated protein 1-like isoform X2 n=1 Tax=Tachypleus tridentatus TaxID=6853 RepID=UPI003FD28B26
MSNKFERERQKQIQEKCQTILAQLLREEDNKYCVDCDAKGPRWASWNLGVFLCIRCAGIHRNLGVHITKVKSVNLDTWTPEQIGILQEMGNSRARAVYEANLPDNFRRPQTDSSLEAFIRAKYEHKRYIAKEWVPPSNPKPAFNIEEKKKKRTKPKGLGNIEIPIRSSNSPSQPPLPLGKSQPISSDLLGTDISKTEAADDIFDSFLSAPVVSSATPTTTTVNCTVTVRDSGPENASQTAQLDDKDFFNQIAPSESQKKSVLTKESILSLYGSGASQGPQQPSYVLPAGLYVPQPIYQTPSVIGGLQPGGQLGVPNGMIGNQFQSNEVLQSASAVPSTNPFISLEVGQQGGAAWGSGVSNSGQGSPGFGQLHQQMASLQLGGQPWGVMGNLQPLNPTLGGQPMSVSSSTGMGTVQPTTGTWSQSPQDHTLSTNLWH